MHVHVHVCMCMNLHVRVGGVSLTCALTWLFCLDSGVRLLFCFPPFHLRGQALASLPFIGSDLDKRDKIRILT